jgi:cell division septation protein DedD
MTKKIIGGIGILVGLGLATFLVYLLVFPEGDSRSPAPDPAKETQVAAKPTPESPQEPATPPPGPTVAPEPGTPSSPEAAPAPSEPGAPVAKPTPPPPAKQEMAELRPLEPTEEYGLLAGRYRSFGSAKKRMAKIKEKNIPAFVRPQGKYYEVWAGPFATPEEAEKARKFLKGMKIFAKKRKLIIPVPK